MATFHPFPRLPAELRLQIWEMTVEPRDVEIRYPCQKTRNGDWIRLLYSSTPIPAPLQTCRESRNAGLYQRFVPFENDSKDEQETFYRYVWANLDIDMIFVKDDELRHFEANGHLIKRLKFVGHYGECWSRLGGNDGLRNFPNVTEIQVVLSIKSYFEHWHGASQDYWPCGEEHILFIDTREGEEMTLLDLESKYDRIWTQIETEQGSNYVYYKGYLLSWPEDSDQIEIDDQPYYVSNYARLQDSGLEEATP